MTDKRSADDLAGTNAEKDPKDWVTGDEPMTGAQRSYLKTLSEQAKTDFDPNLTKADASRRIDELQHQTGRGLEPGTAKASDAGARDDKHRGASTSNVDEEGGAPVDELDVDGDGSHGGG